MPNAEIAKIFYLPNAQSMFENTRDGQRRNTVVTQG